MITKIRDIVWPVLESSTSSDNEKIARSENDDIKNIQKTDWASASKQAMEEAHRLATEEDERRKTAESKASNILVVATAFIPLLTYLETAILEAKYETAPIWITLPILAVAVAYLCNAGWWAFQTVRVANYHRVYSVDLIKIWRTRKSIQKKLVADTLIAIRRNQETVNKKVSSFNMSHKFLLRAIVAFSALLLVRIAFGLVNVYKQPVLDLVHHWF
jgi:hypothetical protein